jgi:type IV secretion system protein VirB3
MALDREPLFVADTRPAMAYGVPYELAGLFLLTFGTVFIDLPFFYNIAVIVGVLVPAWFAARWLVRRDYNAPRCVLLWFQGKAWSFDAADWGGAGPEPFPTKEIRQPRGIVD